MNNVYKPDIGTVISLNTGQVITGGTLLSIEVKKPSGALASWQGFIGADTRSVEHTILAGELDEAGDYILQAKLSLSGGTFRGKSVELPVLEIFT
jgi:hypothetical protein